MKNRLGPELCASSLREKLDKVVEQLFFSGVHNLQLREEVLQLTSIIANSSEFTPYSHVPIEHGETQTNAGLAVSPTMAAMCADDYMRTIMFIKGLHSAVSQKLTETSERPVKVLYVGCGPYALLAIPLMTLFSAEEVKFTLLDIHQHSTDSVLNAVTKLNLQGHIDKVVNIDAAEYEISASDKPDVVVMEIMQNCLQKEPQVLVSHHILHQAPEATLVPEDISIQLALININDDLSLDKKADAPYQHIDLGTVFSVNKETIQRQKTLNSHLSASCITLPKIYPKSSIPMLKTEITVFGDYVLNNYQSGLTTPRSLDSYCAAKKGDTIQFGYQLGMEPRITGQIL